MKNYTVTIVFIGSETSKRKCVAGGDPARLLDNIDSGYAITMKGEGYYDTKFRVLKKTRTIILL